MSQISFPDLAKREMLPCRCGCGELAPKLVRVRVERGHPEDGRAYIPGHQVERIDPERPERKCSTCREVKPREEFNRNRALADGLANECKLCAAYRVRKWNRGPGKAVRRKRVYGLSDEKYQAMLREQDYRCAICRAECDLAVDHCHATGKVRGLLCFLCNSGLGKFHDDRDKLRQAIDYLDDSRLTS